MKDCRSAIFDAGAAYGKSARCERLHATQYVPVWHDACSYRYIVLLGKSATMQTIKLAATACGVTSQTPPPAGVQGSEAYRDPMRSVN